MSELELFRELFELLKDHLEIQDVRRLIEIGESDYGVHIDFRMRYNPEYNWAHGNVSISEFVILDIDEGDDLKETVVKI